MKALAIAATSLVLLAWNGFQADPSPRFDVERRDVLIDEVIPIAVSGLPPAAAVTVQAKGGQRGEWTSEAVFLADASGHIDATRMAPVRGAYKDVDPMGLFWSAQRGRPEVAATDSSDDAPASPASWTLTLQVGGRSVASLALQRRAVAATVRVVPLRASGLVGTYYEPPGGGRHPAVVVLGGSGGGIPPAAGPAGGLASRGYAVLALAYFGVEGLPRTLSNIPLEYFGAAFDWLAAQPAVDPDRIGVLGSSRGAELSLLLGTVYPHIRAVVAYMPSNVVWRGCCDMSTRFAWTAGGRPVATMPPPGARNPLESDRAEIQVERIHGPILLVSGKDDGVWASADMAGKVVARLKRHDFAFAYESLVYDHAGHAITRPYTTTMDLDSRRHPLTGRIVHLGGTPSGTARAREDSWRHVLTFLESALRVAS